MSSSYFGGVARIRSEAALLWSSITRTGDKEDFSHFSPSFWLFGQNAACTIMIKFIQINRPLFNKNESGRTCCLVSIGTEGSKSNLQIETEHDVQHHNIIHCGAIPKEAFGEAHKSANSTSPVDRHCWAVSTAVGFSLTLKHLRSHGRYWLQAST